MTTSTTTTGLIIQHHPTPIVSAPRFQTRTTPTHLLITLVLRIPTPTITTINLLNSTKNTFSKTMLRLRSFQTQTQTHHHLISIDRN
jgi:hypothetical protein